MRTINRQIVIIYSLIIMYLITRILSIKFSFLTISNGLNAVIWLGLFLIGYSVSRYNYRRFLDKTDKFQTTFIVVVIYLIVYFLSGLIFGYQYNAYSTNLEGIITNTIIFIPIIIFQEYIRQVLIEYSGRSNKLLVLITILFILISINYSSLLSDFRSPEAGFKFLCSDIIPNIARNVLFTYLTYVSGFKSASLYRILITGAGIYLPILPNVDWFYAGLSGIIVPTIIFILVNYSHTKIIRNTTKDENKKNKPSSYVPVFIFIFLVVGFVLGFFKYMPIAVVSNSMLPIFERGDMAVIEKVKKDDIYKIKPGTVIRFQKDGYYVIHRVVDIEETDEGLLFTTKGDNNNVIDKDKVTVDQILGIYKFKVKYIGFPSVWLSEALR